ncbi:GerMN domain-containing protein [Alkaliphilus peptidifermentans]|uniref:Germination protein M n=1 Tax=Alkaliphilus peptidifermentans DSM 18978 TaxID=1120976 RepID=A0A1G5L260_9FIRM|nr:GerMN domain-containing protein [Alkaliphilus peptidifermentans]SCZ06947.1 germination protein M [Alkaliphilus peptidifermentans DSM 18978]
MKIYRWKLLAPVLCIVVLLSACGNPLSILLGEKDTDVSIIVNQSHTYLEEEGLRQTVLYYKDNMGLVVPMMRSIPWEEGIAKGALRQLVDEPMTREDLSVIGLLPVLPTGTDILAMSINDGLCKVDFNDRFLSYDSEADERAIITSVVYTLTEFPTIDKVQFMVEGKEINKFKFGTIANLYFERGNINLAQEISNDTIPVVVYYKGTANGEDDYFVPVTKGVNALKADIKSVLVALIEGAPAEVGLFSEIPAGVSINDVYVKDGIAYIDFTEEIKRMPENEKLQQSMIYEIGLTLKEVEPTITQVRILSGGKEIQLGSSVQLNLPIYSNEY